MAHTVLTVAALLLVMAPSALGAALLPLTQALGGLVEHRCACGMVRGTCGCPDCERIEHLRVREKAASPVAGVRSRCDEDEVAMADPVVLSLSAASSFTVPRAQRGYGAVPRADALTSRGPKEPAVPPPRPASA